MNRNVLAKTRLNLGQIPVENPAPEEDKYENTAETDAFMALYYQAASAPTETEFETLRLALKAQCAELAQYLDAHWWKYKVKVVRCWTQQNRHFGYQDTSAVEGTHAMCKKWLESSRGDLFTVFFQVVTVVEALC
jgi:hypothetical protein